jgi:perosamine synthetase
MIRLAKPQAGTDEIVEITSVVESGYLSQGPKVAEFEKALANYFAIKHAIAVSSGTAALHLGVLSLGLSEEDEVIVPDFSFPATANAVALAGAIPVLCDIQLETFNIDPDQVRRLITARTKAIMPVHQFGLAANMDAIVKIAEERGLIIIEDAACALGAEYRGQRCGTFGSIACFSFHPRKIITTGEGGVVVTNNDAIAERVRSLRNHGNVDRDFRMLGYNYRISDINAALGIAQMRKLGAFIEARRELSRLYERALSGVPGVRLPLDFTLAKHTYQSYVVYLDDKFDRDKTILALKKSGVEAGIGTYAIHELQYYKDRRGSEKLKLPLSAAAYRRTLALPLYPEMTQDDVRTVCEALQNDLVLK